MLFNIIFYDAVKSAVSDRFEEPRFLKVITGSKRRYTMKGKERLNALEVALNNEQREREFYLKNAKRSKNPLGKAMFEQIADEELEHYERLKQLHEKWEKEESWPETVPLKVKDTIVKDILKDTVKKVEKMPPGDVDDLEALETAIDFEAEGAVYYARLRDKVTDPMEKQFFNLLADMEHEHFVSLKDTQELLKDPAAWYQKTEHTSLDGG
jgi:rubrerythrin